MDGYRLTGFLVTRSVCAVAGGGDKKRRKEEKREKNKKKKLKIKSGVGAKRRVKSGGVGIRYLIIIIINY